jgi:hypothetical protein
MNNLQIKVVDLEKIIKAARTAQRGDGSLSGTLGIRVLKETNTHLGSDVLEVFLKSNYSECVGKQVYIPETDNF